MKFKNLLFIVFLFGLTQACNQKKEFNRGELLEQISQEVIIPSYQASLKEFQQLDSITNIFIKNPDADGLAKLKLQWKKAAYQWNKTKVHGFGPIKDMFLTNSIYNWPADTIAINEAIMNYNNQENYISTLASNAKGLSTLEYLLFASSDKEVLSELSTQKNSKFLKLLTEDLMTHLVTVIYQWEERYKPKFVSNTGLKSNSSLSQLCNHWVVVAEELKMLRIGLPAGKAEPKEIQPKLVEAPYSKYSLKLVEATVVELQRAFNGAEGLGIDDYLEALNLNAEQKGLASKVNLKLNDIKKSINELELNLQSTLQNNPEAIDDLYLQLLDLTILLKTDMMSQLSLVTTYSDNDGD